MKSPVILLFAMTLGFLGIAAQGETTAPRTNELLPGPWRFLFSNTLDEKAEQPSFDDSSWSTVTVPHTWSGPDGTPTGANCWYRTNFSARKLSTGERTYIYFERLRAPTFTRWKLKSCRRES